ncbi:MAG: GNAT family N-acetyltransferase [Coriobacteriia bacterium]|nr:GNAT family N-acetyltransferase [Coriobacteriia bacterium]
MAECRFRDASADEVGRIARTLVAAKLFADAGELQKVHADDPWRIQVGRQGDVAVLGRWRDHLPILSIEALWCPLSAIPDAVLYFLGLAQSRGLTDVVSPPTLVEEMHAYESAGMHPHTVATTFALTRLGVVGEPVLPAGLTLRSAGHSDIPALLGVDLLCFEPFWRYDERHMVGFCEKGRLAIAEKDGEAVGYTLCTVDGAGGLLGRLCVAPEHRRQGIGTCLLADAVRYVRERGGDRVALSTQTDNMPSRALYRAAHFRDTGRRYAFLRFGTGEG